MEKDHQGLLAGIGVGLLQVLERQVALQGGLSVDSGGCQQREQSEKLQHKPSFTVRRIRDRD
ncbi:hypothetical protein D3C76_1073700 [compost metagenome]